MKTTGHFCDRTAAAALAAEQADNTAEQHS